MKLMYQIKNYLRIIKVDKTIHIGSLPPTGKYIENLPSYLENLFVFSQEKHTKEEFVQFISNNSNLSQDDSAKGF